MVLSITQNVALISFAGIALYFVISRHKDFTSFRAKMLVGGVFSLIAFLVTMTPIHMPDGATIDARAGPVILAGMIGGPFSAIIAAIGGASARSMIGGAFSFSGVIVFFFYAAAGTGLWFANRARSKSILRFGPIASAAVLSLFCAAMMFFFISPRDVALRWITNDYLIIAIANTMSVLTSGLVSWVAVRAAASKTQLRVTVDQLRVANELAEEANAKIQHEATHDPLTHLPNRRALQLHVQDLAAHLPGHCQISYLQVDLDRFKSINDAFGHAVGDYVLQEVARQLKSIASEMVFVARMGGDEFCLVMHDEDSVAQAKGIAQAIIQRCAKPIHHNKLVLHVGASVGMATGNPDQLSDLQVNADHAMYAAKSKVGQNFAEYDHEMRQAAERHKRIADGLRVALRTDQIVVHYQPKFKAGSRNIAGLEALVRWHHPTLGLIMPCEFINIADEIGLQHEIDRSVLRSAYATATRLHEENFEIPSIAVNIGMQRLKDPLLLSDVKEVGDFPCQLVFEILETIDFEALDDRVKWVLDGLREHHIKIEVDDFGTGHASITSLLSLNPDGLKLDRSLVAGSKNFPAASEELLKALIDIGKASNIVITAEGVETECHAQRLERLGCDYLQGYYLGGPMSEADLMAWLRSMQSNGTGRSAAS